MPRGRYSHLRLRLVMVGTEIVGQFIWEKGRCKCGDRGVNKGATEMLHSAWSAHTETVGQIMHRACMSGAHLFRSGGRVDVEPECLLCVQRIVACSEGGSSLGPECRKSAAVKAQVTARGSNGGRNPIGRDQASGLAANKTHPPLHRHGPCRSIFTALSLHSLFISHCSLPVYLPLLT